MNAAPMINACFRHQHPEAYDRAEVPEPAIPIYLRYGSERPPNPTPEMLAESREGVVEGHVNLDQLPSIEQVRVEAQYQASMGASQ